MPRPPSTKTLINRALNKQEEEPKAPIVKDMFLPNYSVVKGARNLGAAGSILFLNNSGNISTSSKLTWDNSAENIDLDGSISFQSDATGLAAKPLSTNDIYIRLGDNAGDSKLRVVDSSGVNQVAIDSDGNVGIGVAEPTKKLEVSGNAEITSGSLTFATDNTGIAVPTGSGNDIGVVLGDTAGASLFKIRNTIGTAVATIDSEGDILANSYGGITEANLVDKSATESISGTWDFSSKLHIANGDETNAALAFESDPDTGLYRISTNKLGITTAGVTRLELSGIMKAKAPIATPDVITFAGGDTTPSVKSANVFKTANARAATITDFDQGVESQQITIMANDAFTTVSNNLNIKLNGSTNFVMGVGDTLTLILYDDGDWHEIARMVR